MIREHGNTQTDVLSPLTAQEVLQCVKQTWKNCYDLQTRELLVDDQKIHILWLSTLNKQEWIQQGIIDPLCNLHNLTLTPTLVASVVSGITVTMNSNTDKINQGIADGQVLILLENGTEGVLVNTGQIPTAAIDKPQNESSIAGPQEAFVGSMDTDIGLIRKRLRSSDLKLEVLRLGTRAHISVALLYFDGITNRGFVETARQRLKGIHIDHLLSVSYVREIIRDHRYSPFPTLDVTERPDRVVGALVEGRIAIYLDGSPQAIMAPTTFISLLSTAEDYHQSYLITPVVRALRHISFWLAVLLPALYISLLSYNHDLIPTPLLINIANQHTGIPFPTIVEMFVMVFLFEILREAGIRLPKTVGQSVSIVGGLVIGEAAVTAGLVSPGAVIVVAATGVSSFTIPSLELTNTARILQPVFMLTASFFGLYGVVVTGTLLIMYMTSLESLGVAYLTPFAPVILEDLKGALIRRPWWRLRKRPEELAAQDSTRK